IDESWRNRIDGNAVGRKQLRERACENQDPGFRNVMGCDVWLRNHVVGIGHAEADDVTGLTRFHAGRDGLRKIENWVEVTVEHLVPALDSFFEEIDSVVGAGSVNEHIDFAPGLFDLGHQALRRNRVGHIATNRQRLAASFGDGEGCLLGLGFAGPVAESNFPMSCREVEGNPTPNSFGPARDQCHSLVHEGLLRFGGTYYIRDCNRLARSWSVPAVRVENDCSFFGFLASRALVSKRARRSSMVSTSLHGGNSAVLSPSVVAFSWVIARTRAVDQGIPTKRSGTRCFRPIR